MPPPLNGRFFSTATLGGGFVRCKLACGKVASTTVGAVIPVAEHPACNNYRAFPVDGDRLRVLRPALVILRSESVGAIGPSNVKAVVALKGCRLQGSRPTYLSKITAPPVES